MLAWLQFVRDRRFVRKAGLLSGDLGAAQRHISLCRRMPDFQTLWRPDTSKYLAVCPHWRQLHKARQPPWPCLAFLPESTASEQIETLDGHGKWSRLERLLRWESN